MRNRTNKSQVGRINIYVPDPTIRRKVKAAAAKRDLSISEYCLRAITNQLITDGEELPRRTRHSLKAAITEARRFRSTFGGQVFAVSSAELIGEARNDRGK